MQLLSSPWELIPSYLAQWRNGFVIIKWYENEKEFTFHLLKVFFCPITQCFIILIRMLQRLQYQVRARVTKISHVLFCFYFSKGKSGQPLEASSFLSKVDRRSNYSKFSIIPDYLCLSIRCVCLCTVNYWPNCHFNGLRSFWMSYKDSLC